MDSKNADPRLLEAPANASTPKSAAPQRKVRGWDSLRQRWLQLLGAAWLGPAVGGLAAACVAVIGVAIWRGVPDALPPTATQSRPVPAPQASAQMAVQVTSPPLSATFFVQNSCSAHVFSTSVATKTEVFVATAEPRPALRMAGPAPAPAHPGSRIQLSGTALPRLPEALHAAVEQELLAWRDLARTQRSHANSSAASAFSAEPGGAVLRLPQAELEVRLPAPDATDQSVWINGQRLEIAPERLQRMRKLLAGE